MMAEIPTRYRARERARACRAQGLRRARPGRARTVFVVICARFLRLNSGTLLRTS